MQVTELQIQQHSARPSGAISVLTRRVDSERGIHNSSVTAVACGQFSPVSDRTHAPSDRCSRLIPGKRSAMRGFMGRNRANVVVDHRL